MAKTQNTSLQSFNFQSNEVRTLTIDNEPWFVAADVLSALGLDRKALERLDDDEKGVCGIHTPGGLQGVNTVNEPGLYNLILGSRNLKNSKDRAEKVKQFKRWVTHEVLPAIRKTGGYQTAQAAREAENTDFVFYPCDYHGRHWLFWINGGIKIAARPLFELLGLDWLKWAEWLKRDWIKWDASQVGASYPNGEHLPDVLALHRVPALLQELAPELNPAGRALAECWRAGLVPAAELAFATRHAPTAESLLAAEPLSAIQQEQIKAAVRARLAGSDYTQAGVLYLYGRLKRQFCVDKWTDIQRRDFEAALQLIEQDDARALLNTPPARKLLQSAQV